MNITRASTYSQVSTKHEDSRKKLIFCACLISLLLVAIGTLSRTTIKLQTAKAKALPSHIPHAIVSRTIVSACKNTLYQPTCESSLASVGATDAKSPEDLFRLSIRLAISRAQSARSTAYDLSLSDQKLGTAHLPSGMDDCIELIDDSLMQLSDVVDPARRASPDDIKTWLSAALTHQETCIQGLENHQSPKAMAMLEKARNLTHYISNSLALYTSMASHKVAPEKSGGARKLLSDRFPDWVSAGDRKLLETPVEELRPHAVVAADGSGTHKTISEALLSVSQEEGGGGSGRRVIHVTAGTYSEGSLNIPSKQRNLMLVGDGKGVTVITGHKSSGDGSSTFSSATFGVTGEGFIARDITFVNSAGPGGHQAVALRVGSDRSVIYRCSIEGHQDTLYTLSNRQFYRETDIYGTVDFIFGNSAVVFQSCNINAIGSSNQNYVTAQGRTDPNQNTGISIQSCKVSGTSRTYLGRPWKKFSRTVVMQSSLSGIDSAGWYPWSGSFALSTLYYAEYMNSGPSSSTSGRVDWGGYHASISTAEANQFTVAEFISGNGWLPGTGVPFDAGL